VSARATFLASARALVEAVSGLQEHKGAVTEEGMPASVASRTVAQAAFVVSMPGGVASPSRQRGDIAFVEALVVGYLIDVKQGDRPAALARALTIEDLILTALLGDPKVAGGHLEWTATDRGDAGDGAYLACRMAFTVRLSSSLGA
jgi:hypothetical protein